LEHNENIDQDFIPNPKKTRNIGNIVDVESLEGCITQVYIQYACKLETYRNEIQKYEKYERPYQIVLDFDEYHSSLEDKTKIVGMINELKVNHKVGALLLRIDPNNEFDTNILRVMINNYHNVYDMDIHDC